MTQIYAVILIC